MHGLAFAGTVGTFLLVVLLLKPGARLGAHPRPAVRLAARRLDRREPVRAPPRLRAAERHLPRRAAAVRAADPGAGARHATAAPPRALAASAALSVADAGAAVALDARQLQLAAGAVARRRSAARRRHPAALHRREPALDRVPRRLRRVAGAHLPALRQHPRRGLAGAPGIAARAVLRLAAQALLVRHAPGRGALEIRAGGRLARDHRRAVSRCPFRASAASTSTNGVEPTAGGAGCERAP